MDHEAWLAWLVARGETGRLVAHFDWASTPLGPLDGWTPDVRIAVNGCLAASVPALLFIGPEGVAVYNDLAIPTVGDAHPSAFGQSGAQWWPRDWSGGPVLATADRDADASWRRAITEALRDPIFIAEPDGLVVECNEAFTDFLGWTASDAGRPPYPWWPDAATDPEAHELIRAAHDRIFDGQDMSGDFLLRHRDGTPRWASVWGKTVDTPERGRTTVLKLMHDVTDERAARIAEAEQVAEREHNLSRAIESHRFVGQAIGILVERHRITPNAAFELLREASQHRNQKLRDVAERVVTTGEEP